MKTDNNKMTAAERRDLCSLIRQRARLMKAQAAQRGNELMADFEAQLTAAPPRKAGLPRRIAAR